jgi:hypothetical protein
VVPNDCISSTPYWITEMPNLECTYTPECDMSANGIFNYEDGTFVVDGIYSFKTC